MFSTFSRKERLLPVRKRNLLRSGLIFLVVLLATSSGLLLPLLPQSLAVIFTVGTLGIFAIIVFCLSRPKWMAYALITGFATLQPALLAFVLREYTGRATVTGGLMLAALAGWLLGKKRKLLFGVLIVPCIVYALYFLASMIVSISAEGLRLWILYVGAPVVMYIFLSQVSGDNFDGVGIVKLVVVIAVAQSVVSIVTSLLTRGVGWIPAAIQSGNLGTAYRKLYVGWFFDWGILQAGHSWSELFLAGTFAQPNALAAFLALAIPQALWLRSHAESRRVKSIYLLGIILMLAAVFLSFARGAWVGLIVGLLVLVFTRKGTARYATIGLFLFLGLTILSVSPIQELIRLRWEAAGTVQQRLDLVSISLRLFLRSPLVGIGWGRYAEAALQYGYNVNPHNDYLYMLAEGGILGLIAFVWPLLTMLGFTVKRWFRLRNVRLRDFSAAFLASLIGFLTMSLFNPLQQLAVFLMTLFAAFEMVVSSRRSDELPDSD